MILGDRFMAVRHAKDVFRQLRTLFGAGTTVGVDDLQLLERFVSGRDEAAFEALIARHGPMVLGVCRRFLANPADVDDAFQATFLVLVKRAGSLRNRDLLAHWLYGVANRVAMHARSEASRRPPIVPVGVMPAPSADLEQRELRSMLDEEIQRLPERFRLPVVLCYLEGLTHEEAAQRLGCPLGTVNSRLATARERLRDRLTRRGLASTAGLLSALVLSRGAPAGVLLDVPAPLVHSTVQAALQFAQGPAVAAGTVSATAFALAKGVLTSMFFTKLKTLAAVVLAAGTVVIGAGVIAGQEANEKKAAPPTEVKSAPDAVPEKAVSQAAETDLRQILREAARVAITAEDDFSKAQTLRDIAKEQLAAGDREAARVNFQTAAQTVRGLTGAKSTIAVGRSMFSEASGRAFPLAEIAIAQADAGFGADAIETVQGIPVQQTGERGDAVNRNQVMALISTALANAGDYENALKAAASINERSGQSRQLSDIAMKMVLAGDVKGALQAAELLTDKESNGAFLRKIAFAQAQSDPQGARLWADKLESPILKSQVLLAIVQGMSQKPKDQAASEPKPSPSSGSVEAKPGTRKAAAPARNGRSANPRQD
jgi:RNA polymerase sigma factor (sigma-70 family)